MNLRWLLGRVIGPKLLPLYRKLTTPPPPNDLGNRDIEHSFVAANIPTRVLVGTRPSPNPDNKLWALDYGCGNTWLVLVTARKGYSTIAVDLSPPQWLFESPHIIYSPPSERAWQSTRYNLIICCSTIEHVGVPGRYGVEKEERGLDLELMKKFRGLLVDGGRLILTTEVGQDTYEPPYHRVYGEVGLSRLLTDWEIVKEEYWMKDNTNRWIQATKSTALSIKPKPHYYGLGLWVLG